MRITSFKDSFLSETEQLFLDYPDTFNEQDRHHWREDLLQFLLKATANTHVFVIEADGQVAGAVMFHKDTKAVENYWEIDWLVVKKMVQNQGVGTQLIEFAFKYISEKGGKHIYLRTSSDAYNRSTLHFYKKIGFEKLATLPDYYTSTIHHHTYVENAVLLHHSLTK